MSNDGESQAEMWGFLDPLLDVRQNVFKIIA